MITSVFVVFIITAEFLVSAVYTGGVPFDEHTKSLKLGNVLIIGYGNVTVGWTGQNKENLLILKFSKYSVGKIGYLRNGKHFFS